MTGRGRGRHKQKAKTLTPRHAQGGEPVEWQAHKCGRAEARGTHSAIEREPCGLEEVAVGAGSFEPQFVCCLSDYGPEQVMQAG